MLNLLLIQAINCKGLGEMLVSVRMKISFPSQVYVNGTLFTVDVKDH